MKLLEHKYISIFIGFVAIGIIIAVYSPVITSSFFCWDDNVVPLAPIVRTLNYSQIVRMFSTYHAGLYHPLTTLSFAIDYKIGHGNASFFHIVNILIHIINIYLVFILSLKLFRNKISALIIALFFGILPVNVEVVAWITSRKDLLFTMFFISGLIAYIGFLKSRKWDLYAITIVLFIFSLLSKIQSATFPIILLGLDYFNKRQLFSRKVILEKIPFFILAGIFSIINILAQKDYGYVDYGGRYSLPEQVITFCSGFNHYIMNLLFPFNISIFYPFPFNPGAEIPALSYLQPLIFLIYILMLIYLSRQNQKDYFFSGFFFLVTISVALIIQNHRDAIIADRYSYLASLGILFLIAKFLIDITNCFPKIKLIASGFVIVYFLMLAVMTFYQSLLWQTPYQLMEVASRHYPDTPIILNTMATEKIKTGDYEEALVSLNTVIKINPRFNDAYYNRGIVFNHLQNFEDALTDFTVCISNNPYYTEAYFGRGNIYRQMGSTENAIKDYSKVILLDRNNVGAWNNRAIVKGQQGNFDGAIADLDVAIHLQPDLGPAYYLRGVAKCKVGLDGCDDLHKALALNYKNADRAVKFYCGK